MARRRHTPEQIIRKLREADRLLGEGAEVADVARHLEVCGQWVRQRSRWICFRPPAGGDGPPVVEFRRPWTPSWSRCSDAEWSG